MNTKRKFFSELSENKELCFFGIFLIAYIFKYLIYGLRYFPVLDDYIQYGGYPLYKDPSFVFLGIGTIATRPLASILDVFLWGSLWNTPHLMLIVSCAFHFFSWVLFYKTAKANNITISPLFGVFYLFFPFGYEGSYWISASSRIVVGLFFGGLTLLALTKYQHSGKIKYFLAFFVCALCSYTLYESSAVFCFLACAVILFINRDKKRFILPFVSLCVLMVGLFVYMKLIQQIGGMGSRASESSFKLIFTQADDFLTQLKEISLNGIPSIIIKGFSSGLLLLFKKGVLGILYVAVMCAICVIAGRLTAGTEIKKPNKNTIIFQIAVGVILFIAPFAPNMITSPVWITYRTMFIPFVGAYLILDVIFAKLPKKSIQAIILSSFMFIFMVSGINEYDTYKRTSELDKALIQKICMKLSDDAKEGKCDVAVLLDAPPEIEQVDFYKDHVKNLFYADWSLTGGVRAELKNMKIRLVTPVYPDTDFDYSDCCIVDLRTNK